MNAEDFVSYEQAVKLKECGFGEPCITYLNPKYGKRVVIAGKEITMKDCTPSEVLCPSLSQAAKWLREVKGIKVYPIYDYIIQKWYYHCGLKVNRTKCSEASYATYESALSAGIDAALELIKEEA